MASQVPQPTLSSTRSGAGWKLPALAVVVAVVGLVGLTRLGGSHPPAATSIPTTGVPAADLKVVHTPSPTPVPVGGFRAGMPRSPDGLTYADGIPTGIGGQEVYRVRDVVRLTEGRTILVGGWYLDRSRARNACLAEADSSCASLTMSDVPLMVSRDVITSFMAIDSALGTTGPYVVLATVEADPACSIRVAGECQPRLRVLSRVWTQI